MPWESPLIEKTRSKERNSSRKEPENPSLPLPGWRFEFHRESCSITTLQEWIHFQPLVNLLVTGVWLPKRLAVASLHSGTMNWNSTLMPLMGRPFKWNLQQCQDFLPSRERTCLLDITSLNLLFFNRYSPSYSNVLGFFYRAATVVQTGSKREKEESSSNVLQHGLFYSR